MAKDRIKDQQRVDLHIRLIGSIHMKIMQYNAPTISEVVTLVVGDLDASTIGKDIIINAKYHGLK